MLERLREMDALSFFCIVVLLLFFGVAHGRDEEKMNRGPHKVLFSNDTTNILTCVSPYHKKGESFQEKMLEAPVDETSGIGVDIHLLQPAHGWVPWWQSKVYSIQEHHNWWKEHFKVDPRNSVHSYLL